MKIRKISQKEKELISSLIGESFGYFYQVTGGSVEKNNLGKVYHLSIEYLDSNSAVSKSMGEKIKEAFNADAIYHLGSRIA